MTDNDNLVQELRVEIDGYSRDEMTRRELLIARAADALEELHVEVALEQSKNQGYRTRNDELAAVIEKALSVGRVTGYSHHKEPVMDALEVAPADALRQVKAQAWREGYAAGQDSLSGPTGEYVDDPRLKNPYRDEQA